MWFVDCTFLTFLSLSLSCLRGDSLSRSHVLTQSIYCIQSTKQECKHPLTLLLWGGERVEVNTRAFHTHFCCLRVLPNWMTFGHLLIIEMFKFIRLLILFPTENSQDSKIFLYKITDIWVFGSKMSMAISTQFL